MSTDPALYADEAAMLTRMAALAAADGRDDLVAQMDAIGEVDRIVAATLSADTPDLGITAAEAEARRDMIEVADRTDDGALSAHELLHTRAVHGRAW